MNGIDGKLQECREMTERRLETLLAGRTPQLLWDSMRYSVAAGGKRLRPALNLMGAELGGTPAEETLDIACAIEMIHTYSLIHDDLPALDNDSLRRGKPTNHVVFGEAQAILAGDGLLNYAYEVMLANAAAHGENLAAHLEAVSIVAKSAGVGGMIAGQVVDVDLEGKPMGSQELDYIHAHKTGDMITGALLAGLALSRPGEAEQRALRSYGEGIGLVFQIVDDILDVTAGEELGKTRGKDQRDGKTTFVTLYGVEGSKRAARQRTEEAKAALAPFGERGRLLCQLADKLLARKK